MLIGIDFDNTLVRYDELFHRAAVARGLLSSSSPPGKQAVRDALRKSGREDRWTELQGHVYGELIRHAPAWPGVGEFFAAASWRKIEVCIISHKTRLPYLGAPCDLRQAAFTWLRDRGIVAASPADIEKLPPERVWFEATKEEKLARIAAAGCTHFIDDLPEFLREPGFPRGVQRIWFDPSRAGGGDCEFDFAGDWREIAAWLLSPGQP